MGLVKTRRLAAMHPPSPSATSDREAAARDPPTPRLRRIKVWDAAAGEEGRRGVSGLESAVRQGKGREKVRPR